MKLTIIAATGGAGRELRARPLAAGHDITAVARNPGKVSRQVRAITTDLAAAELRGPGAGGPRSRCSPASARTRIVQPASRSRPPVTFLHRAVSLDDR
jgi:hypothetical protein